MVAYPGMMMIKRLLLECHQIATKLQERFSKSMIMTYDLEYNIYAILSLALR